MAAIAVVAGALAVKPGNGGEAWVRLSWVQGLHALGFDTWFVEERVPAPAAEVEWFEMVTTDHLPAGRAVLVSGEHVLGLDGRAAVRELLAAAAVVVNLSGNVRSPDLLAAARRLAYVDLDPGYTQVWHQTGVGDLGLDRHHLHFTVGELVGTSACPLPTGDVRWLPCRQPVVLDDWPASPPPAGAALTTVATWRCPFGPLEWDGVRYGLKLHEQRRLLDLPGRVPVPLELALSMHEADRPDAERLEAGGWRVRDASDVAATPEAFRRYVRASLGELTAVQGVYARARTGWFGDRSARYLASGRPVIVQDTGFGAHLPVGEGLLAFGDADSAAAAVAEVARDPVRHGAAARRLAEEHFDARRVLREFVDRCGVSP